MSDPVLAATIAAAVPLILGAGAALRWWIERRDAQRKERRAERTRELSESEAAKTIRTLERQNDDLRRELTELAVALADREEARLRGGRGS